MTTAHTGGGVPLAEIERVLTFYAAEKNWKLAIGAPAITDMGEQARALLSRIREGGERGWRTMESAPKEGTRIIGVNKKGGVFGCEWWTAERIAHEFARGNETAADFDACWLDDHQDEVFPVAWMPLPPPAQESEE